MTGTSSGAARLPNFLIVGAPRAGTTTLASYLSVHPDVFMVPEKELRFFDLGFDRGVDWYRSRFAGAGDARAVGEATPSYMGSDEAIDRMATVVPEAKLIVILRNPVDRSYSLYWWFRHAESRTFEEAAREEIRGEPSAPGRRRRYLAASLYLPRLQRICERFPREALRVATMEDLNAAPRAVVADLFGFLAVDATFVPPNLGAALNPSSQVRWPRLRLAMLRREAWRHLPRGWADAIDRLNRKPLRYPLMDPALREELAAWFAPHNAELAAWLGRELPGWER